jgi:hypothetical protein
MQRLVACLVLVVGSMTAGCSAGALGSAGVETSSRLPPPSNLAPSPTTGYCGMDPEPVPCVDRPGGDPGPTSVGAVHDLAGTCMQTLPGDRCQALALAAASQLGLGFDQVVAVDVVANPSPDGIDFVHRTFLEVALADGSVHSIVVSCPGISGAYYPPCMPEPVVTLGSPGGAYTDIPENATPFPLLDADAVAASVPLRIPSTRVAVDGLGPHSIVLGRATLPNGRLTEASFGMADPWPSDVLFHGGIQMVVAPTAGGPPLENLYQHGWHAGTEEVEVTLTFDVAWFKPGATFTIVDVVVR